MPIVRPLLLASALLLLSACTPVPFLLAQSELGSDPWREVRLGYVAEWEALRGSGLSGLERFAALVQRMLDDAVARSRDPASPFAGLDPGQLLLDDLVDLFVPDSFRDEKALVMASEPLLDREVIVERAGDLSGFRAELQAGDGRFRHFAMNAAAAYRFPPALVDVAARWLGSDFEDGRELSADSQADIATNEIGRAFATLLQADGAVALAERAGAERWLLERFGP